MTSDKPNVQVPERETISATDEKSTEPQDSSRTTAVRFSSKLEEIEPEHSLHTAETLTHDSPKYGPMSVEEQANLRQISQTLQNTQLQHRRLADFTFEPVSLPASRVSNYIHIMVSLISEQAFSLHVSYWLRRQIRILLYTLDIMRVPW